MTVDEVAIETAGLTLLDREDRTAATAEIAGRWHAARLRRAGELEREEGADWFVQRQRFLAITAEVASACRDSTRRSARGRSTVCDGPR